MRWFVVPGALPRAGLKRAIGATKYEARAHRLFHYSDRDNLGAVIVRRGRIVSLQMRRGNFGRGNYTTSNSLLHCIAEYIPGAKSVWKSAIAECKWYYVQAARQPR
jgi:hypothetical protein